MPDRKTHNKIAKLFVDLPEKKIDWVNKTIDSKIMLAKYGPRHRDYWGHDIRSLALILSQTDEKGEVAKAWYIHMVLDRMPKTQRKNLELLSEYLDNKT